SCGVTTRSWSLFILMTAFLPEGLTEKLAALPPRYLLKTSVIWSARCCGVWPRAHSRMAKQVVLPMITFALVLAGAATAREAARMPASASGARSTFIFQVPFVSSEHQTKPDRLSGDQSLICRW